MDKQISRSLKKTIASRSLSHPHQLSTPTEDSASLVGVEFTKEVQGVTRVFRILNLSRTEDYEFYIVGLLKNPTKPATLSDNVDGIVGIPKRKMISVIHDPRVLILR